VWCLSDGLCEVTCADGPGGGCRGNGDHHSPIFQTIDDIQSIQSFHSMSKFFVLAYLFALSSAEMIEWRNRRSSDSSADRELMGIDCSSQQSKPYNLYCKCNSNSDCYSGLTCDSRFKVCSIYPNARKLNDGFGAIGDHKLGTTSPEKYHHVFDESHNDELVSFNAAHSKEELAILDKMIKEAMSRGVKFETIEQRIKDALASAHNMAGSLPTLSVAAGETVHTSGTNSDVGYDGKISNNGNFIFDRRLRGRKVIGLLY